MLNNKPTFLVVILLTGITLGTGQDTENLQEVEPAGQLREFLQLVDYWLANWLRTYEFVVENAFKNIVTYFQFEEDPYENEIVDDNPSDSWTPSLALFPDYSADMDDDDKPAVDSLDMGEWEIGDV